MQQKMWKLFFPRLLFILLELTTLPINCYSKSDLNHHNIFSRGLKLVGPPKITSSGNYRSIESSSDESIPTLPLCCEKAINDDGYHCRNSLRASSHEVTFKRRSLIVPRHLASTKKPTKFRLTRTKLNCKYENFATTLSLSPPQGSLKHGQTSYFSPDGYLKYKNEYFRPDEYCISGLNENKLEVRVCQANCSDPLTPCILKCCGRNQIYSFGYGDNPRGCVDVKPSKSHWFPTLYHTLDKKLSLNELISLKTHIIQKFPTSFKSNCRFNKTTVFPHGNGISDFLSALTGKVFRNLEFRLRKDGWLLYPQGGQGKSSIEAHALAKKIDNYCVDGAQDYGESSEFSNREEETILFLCSGGVDEAFETPMTILKSKLKQTSIIRNTTRTQIQAEPSTNKVVKLPSRESIVNVKPIIYTTTTLRPSTSTATAKAEEKPSGHLSNFKDRIELEVSDTSASSSLEIEIEDGVPLNSLEKSGDNEDLDFNPESDQFIPAVLKIAVQMPYSPQTTQKTTMNNRESTKRTPGLSQATFNHNNLKYHDHIADGSEMKVFSEKLAIPTCCSFSSSNVNDGLTHHCRNRRMGEKHGNISHGESPILWNVPHYYMTRNLQTSFPLETSPLKCGSGNFQFQGFVHNFEQLKAKTSGEKKHGIFSNGYLKYDNEFYSPDQYCVNGLSPKILEVIICKPDCSMWETPCIKKCCGMDEIYNLGLSSGNRGCQQLNQQEAKFSPKLYKSMTAPVTQDEMKGIRPHFVQKYPPQFQQTCYSGITLAFPYSQDIAEKLTPANSAERGGTAFKHLQFRFRKDGKLMYTYPDPDGTTFDAIYDRGEFCVDAVRDYGESEPFRNNENQTILFICASEPQSGEQ